MRCDMFTMMKSRIARLTTNMLEGVRKFLQLK